MQFFLFFLNSSTCNVAVKTYFLPVWMAKLEKKQSHNMGKYLGSILSLFYPETSG